MPKASRRTSGSTASTNRKEPYAKTSPKSHSTPDKENVDPQSKSKAKPKSSKHRPPPEGDYRDIELEEVTNEVPCYDNAATVRRKLNKLLSDKGTIPGTDNKKWSRASMASEMQELENRGHPVEYNRNANGPTVSSLTGFLKKTGNMGGGDSPCYYWGYVLLEKLRIYNGEKKSKPREKAESDIPNGHMRWDPKTQHLLCGPGLPPPTVDEMNNAGR